MNADRPAQISASVEAPENGSSGAAPTRRCRGPVLTLLLLSPAIGELLSGSSPPLMFFNPVFLLLLVGLYGCGSLLIREIVVRRRLNVTGLLLLGAAYAIVEEGLTCKSFFNPFWNDVGFMSTYGRALGVNWLWTLGLILYHAVVSITVPVCLTHALFPGHASTPWLRRRGLFFASAALAFVTLLGFSFFDTAQFHQLELRDPAALARNLMQNRDPLSQFISARFNPKNRLVIENPSTPVPKLRHALLDELNRLLQRPDLFSAERFAQVKLDDETRRQLGKPLKDDRLVRLNRRLLEQAYPEAFTPRAAYPFRLSWQQTLGCVLAIAGLCALALRQTSVAVGIVARRPRAWLNGLWFTPAFFGVAFVVPGLVENGAKVPALVTALLMLGLGVLAWRALWRLDFLPGQVWLRGLWALGVAVPWTFFALLLGLVVGMQGAKSFAGMSLVALAALVTIFVLRRRWQRVLNLPPTLPTSAHV
jgi:hypothetical protein